MLLSLAEHAGNDGSCYPSMRRIAERTRLSLRGAQTAMRALEAKGAIRTSRNIGPHGCNRYTAVMPPADSASPADSAPPAHAAPRTDCTPPQMATPTPAEFDMRVQKGGNQSMRLFEKENAKGRRGRRVFATGPVAYPLRPPRSLRFPLLYLKSPRHSIGGS